MHIIKCTGGNKSRAGEEGTAPTARHVTVGAGEGDRSQGIMKVGIILQSISKFTILTSARDKLPHQVWSDRQDNHDSLSSTTHVLALHVTAQISV